MTLPALHPIHGAFTPEELLFVDLVLQNPEAESVKNADGRFRQAAKSDPVIAERELSKLRNLVVDPAGSDLELPKTTACVSVCARRGAPRRREDADGSGGMGEGPFWCGTRRRPSRRRRGLASGRPRR